MAEQALHDIIRELPSNFVQRINEETDVRKLKELARKHYCYNRRALILARIENLQHLCINP